MPSEFDAQGNWVKQTQTLCTMQIEESTPVYQPYLVTYRTITCDRQGQQESP